MEGMAVRVTVDVVANAATIYVMDPIMPGTVVSSHVCDLDVEDCAVVLDLDASGRLVSIEILGASKLLPPEGLANAERIP
jgi:uncharacterized protein YuzE